MSTSGRRLLAALAAVTVVAAAGVFAAAAVAATAPTNTTAPSIGGKAATGQTLTASPGEWSGDGNLTFAYEWRLCDLSGAKCDVIANATAKTYTLAASEQGHTLRVVVTASNGAGSASATSAATDPVSVPLVGSITLKAPGLLVPYGKKVTFSGTVANAPHTTVWIEAGAANALYKYVVVASAQTDANGAFSVKVQPLRNTTYYAEQDGMRSPFVTIDVAPRIVALRLSLHTWSIKALAGEPLAGKVVLLQSWNPIQHTWISIAHVKLQGVFVEGGPANSAVASINLSHFAGKKTRVVMQSQIPGYASSVPAVFRG